ncbi:MAG: outer membrane lipoprotein-sorting protein [Candidatus Latescibacteria bacterium]|nr:outer membrane lipoprotein-sorting protein [Candidatus Latescibacterota bacterium]
MKNNKIKTFTIAITFFLFWIVGLAQNQELTAIQILQKVDQCLNGPSDQEMRLELLLIDKNGREQTREIMMMQKGSDKRIGKFLSPADQKGIGFLSLPDNVFYIYLPAYKKTRRIAAHIKNTKFAGTDFTYEDMEAKNYSRDWTVQTLSSENSWHKLELLPKPGVSTEYGKIILRVRTDNFYPEIVEYYDKADKLYKKMTSDKIEKVDGFWVAKESFMEDLKSGHKTRMILQDVKFNTNIAADKFTERYLAQ